MALILASQSKARQQLLAQAGVEAVALPAFVDEDSVKEALVAEGASPRQIADSLAEIKALKISAQQPGDLVVGADQILVCSGEMFSKAPHATALAAQLAKLQGKEHRLITAACVAKDGQVEWRHIDQARLWMRPLSAPEIKTYLDKAGADVLGCVGGYQLEGVGVQLFERIEGSHFTILGLPLLPLLTHLRRIG